MKRTFTVMAALVGLTWGTAQATVEIGKPAPAFTLPSQDGTNMSLSSYKGKYVVLEWFNPQCPFVKKHYESGNMQKLQQTYMDKGVVWLTINSSAKGKEGYTTPKEAADIRMKWKSPSTAVLWIRLAKWAVSMARKRRRICSLSILRGISSTKARSMTRPAPIKRISPRPRIMWRRPWMRPWRVSLWKQPPPSRMGAL